MALFTLHYITSVDLELLQVRIFLE